MTSRFCRPSWALIAVALAVGAVIAIAAPAHATFPGRNGEIAVSCSLCSNPPYNNIELFSADGSWPPVGSEGGKAYSPTWSPRGSILAWNFQGSVANEIRFAFGDAVLGRPLGGGGGGVTAPAFAPDGRHLFYSMIDWFPPSPEDDGTGYYISPLDGSPPRRISTTAKYLRRASWSPGGSTILLGGYGYGITAVNALSGTERSVTAGDSPDWAPSGRAFAFHNTVDGNSDIYVATTKTPNTPNIRTIKRITTNAASDSDPGWSPDGTTIVFVSDRDGHDELYTVRPDGSGERRLTHVEPFPEWGWPDMEGPAWRPLPRR